MPLSGEKVDTALMSPLVPMEIRSSVSTPEAKYFFTICATSRRLCSISVSRASVSPPGGPQEAVPLLLGCQGPGEGAGVADAQRQAQALQTVKQDAGQHSIAPFALSYAKGAEICAKKGKEGENGKTIRGEAADPRLDLMNTEDLKVNNRLIFVGAAALGGPSHRDGCGQALTGPNGTT